MLKLRCLELSGFKSFVDPVKLEVHDGLTAIVGPNGCGKSNIADAVVWALGERSAKSLRGETMEDVIFAGAKTRKPLGMAEVTLELVSDNGFPTTDDGRMLIGRRVFRNGESHYFLNGKSVRLKDVKDLLMDTGLGIRAYSMIEQGKIGMILSGKPQERRRLLEEAAGITRYRERRRIAELKLEEARANLARVDDIIAEVERAVRSLKRQASAARRFNKKQEEYRHLLRQVLEGRWADLQARLAAFRQQIAELTARETEATATLHSREAAFAEARQVLDALGKSVADRHDRVARLAATIEGKQEFLKGSATRLQEIAERIAGGEEAAEQRRSVIAELETQLETLQARRGALLDERRQAASEVSADEDRISEAEMLVSEAAEQLESLRGRLLSSISLLSGLRNRHHRELVESEKAALRRRHLADELKRKQNELAEVARSLEESEARLAELQSAVATIEEKGRQHRQTLEEVSKRNEATTAALTASEQHLRELEHRQQLLVELAGQRDQRRNRLEEALRLAGCESFDFLSETLEVPEGWAASLDLFLGELEDAIVLPPGTDALALAHALVASRTAGHLVQPAEGGADAGSQIDDSAILSTLAAALRLPAAIGAALPPGYLVGTAADARRLAARHPGVAFIARDRLWAQAGTLHVQGEQATPGQLESERERSRLGQLEPALRQEVAAQAAEAERLAADTRLHQGRIAQYDQELADRRQILAVAQARHDDTAGRHGRLTSERQTLSDELAETDTELERLSHRLANLSTQVEETQTTHRALEQAFDGAQAGVDQARLKRESTRTSGASRRGRLELLAERLDTFDQELARATEEIAEHWRQIEHWRQEAERLAERQLAVKAAMAEAERELQSALEQRHSSQQDVLTEQGRLDEQRLESTALEESIDTARRLRDELRAEISEVRVTEAGLRQDAEHLSGTFRQELGTAPPSEPGELPQPLEELEADMARAKEMLERLGPVNLLATAEYEEQAQRQAFLTTQREDVASSVARLKQTIREINETSSQRFKETFDEVNSHFRQTFVDLFRGGEAEMRLLDEGDLLESVIEIVARPPGKRLQNLMLLSGGEKALAAIALLFALFKTKPSPFCILDEVDAPLDDVNTLRFVELLKRMSSDTQFVVITHNKLTMEAASLLYGVTMQERGVSNLVAVELDSVQPYVGAGLAPALSQP